MILNLLRKYWKRICTLLCIFLICTPWLINLLGAPVPKGIMVVSAWIGIFGLFLLLVLTLKIFIERS